jgi:glycine dehydrogenase subunit 1
MRYLPHTNSEIKEMLKVIGAADIEDLFSSIPKDLRTKKQLDLGAPLAEPALLEHLKKLSGANKNTAETISFLGGGAYRHFIPSAVSELAGRAEFVTPYTPYQPEISQGTLQTMFEYQSMMCRLFDMDVSNASNYDAATSVAEAALLSRRVGKKRKTFFMPDNLHPEYRDVVRTVLGNDDTNLCTLPSEDGLFNRRALKDSLNDDLAGVVVGFPNFFGIVEDLKDVADMVHKAGGIFIAAVSEPLSLALLSPPGSWGADIAVGEGISFGLPVSFGGPTLGIFTAKEAFLRNMPGRICGMTTDTEGRRGFVLTISTREQHIRREKATSNICSNQALCASTAAIYLSLLGKNGLQELADLNLGRAEYAKKRLTQINGVKLKFNAPAFNEFVLELPKPANTVLAALLKDNIFGGIDLGRWYPNLKNCILVCVTEMISKNDIDLFADKLGTVLR